MIAEDRDRAVAELAHEAQYLQRFRPAVDEVADQPQPVVAAEAQSLEERLQLVEAPLHIADRIGRHLP